MPALVGFAMGMAGELHVYMPGFGTLPMLDLVSYFISIPILCANWGRMGKFMRRSLVWAFVWTVAAVLANLLHFYDFRYWMKCVSVASSSWAIMAAAYILLRKYPQGYLWYLVGAGLGGWIALHYFRNGALEAFVVQKTGLEFGDSGGQGMDILMEKQKYPSIARGMLYGFVLPFFIWWRKAPVFLALCATVFAGFYLLFNGGSRSGFGIFCAAAGMGFCVSYGTRAFRRLSKSPVMMLIVSAIALSVLFGGYKYFASSGMMGEGEAQKLENEFGKDGAGAINGRAGFKYAFQQMVESGGVGLGGDKRFHSVAANAMACEGLIGVLFWCYFSLQCFWFICHRLPYSGRYAFCIFLMVLIACWDVFGSPFAIRHKFFVLMAFIALCRDNLYYGVGTVFDESMVGRRRFIGVNW